MWLYHHVLLDILHDQDPYLLFVYTIYVFHFLILADRYNLVYYDLMLVSEYFDDYVHVLFHAMYEIRQ